MVDDGKPVLWGSREGIVRVSVKEGVDRVRCTGQWVSEGGLIYRFDGAGANMATSPQLTRDVPLTCRKCKGEQCAEGD